MKTVPDFLSHQVSEARRYFLNLSPEPTTALTVVCGGCEKCQPDYEVSRQGLEFYCVEYVAQGEGSLLLNGREYLLRPGMVFSYGPGVPHVIRNDPHHVMVKYYVDFAGREAAALLSQSPLGGGQALQVSDSNQIYELFELLQRNGIGGTPYSQEICSALIPILLLKIAEKAIPYAPDDTRALICYQRCRQYMETHFARLKALEEVARANFVSAAYLCRLFRRFDHMSPYQYLLRLKMNRAAEQLLESGMLVKQVAAEVAFSDPYNFSRAFKGVFGMSPEKFVKRGQHMQLGGVPGLKKLQL